MLTSRKDSIGPFDSFVLVHGVVAFAVARPGVARVEWSGMAEARDGPSADGSKIKTRGERGGHSNKADRRTTNDDGEDGGICIAMLDKIRASL